LRPFAIRVPGVRTIRHTLATPLFLSLYLLSHQNRISPNVICENTIIAWFTHCTDGENRCYKLFFFLLLELCEIPKSTRRNRNELRPIIISRCTRPRKIITIECNQRVVMKVMGLFRSIIYQAGTISWKICVIAKHHNRNP
jgi:hypothetical protein